MIGLPMVLFVVFLVLKLTGNIMWSWIWVTAPLWIGVGIGVLMYLIVLVFALLVWFTTLLGWNFSKKNKEIK